MSRTKMSAEERKGSPIYSGVLKYFPDAMLAVARLSKVGNDQHNPGQPLHWAREKSTDHGDCILRHLLDAGTLDTDGQRHTAKVAWRALAMLQEEIEKEQAPAVDPDKLEEAKRRMAKNLEDFFKPTLRQAQFYNSTARSAQPCGCDPGCGPNGHLCEDHRV